MIENPIFDALKYYNANIKDSTEWLVIFDEIQESSEIYNEIRQMARNLNIRFIVTGSYLGIVYKRSELFLPAGDTLNILMESITFPEFLGIFGLREKYESLDLFGISNHSDYDEIKKYFDIYLKIGGYPEVILKYLETKSFQECDVVIEHLINIFTNESNRYMPSIPSTIYFKDTFDGVVARLVKEKKGTSDYIEDLFNIINKNGTNRINKMSIVAAINWLYASHQIGFVSTCIDCSVSDKVYNSRCYFNDIGLARSFLSNSTNSVEELEGLLCENFVYLELCRRIKILEIDGDSPWFAIDKQTDEELDFFCMNRSDKCKYGIEIKRGRNKAKTGLSLLKSGKLDYLYILRDTYGGKEYNVLTVAIYLAGRVRFDLGKTLKKSDAF